ncbi:hypothetical protein Tco_0025627 [Tanacetum coccineum]
MQLVLDCLIIASIIDVKSVSYGVIIVFSYLMFGSNGEVQRIENKAKTHSSKLARAMLLYKRSCGFRKRGWVKIPSRSIADRVVRRWSTAIDRWSGGGSDDDWPGHVAPSPVMVTCGTANDWVRWWRYECGNPVEGPNCQGCALWQKKLKEVWFTICHENGIYQDLLNTYESSADDTNVANAPREPFVVNQDPGQNSSQSPPHINHHCCYECGDSLDDIFCQRCTCQYMQKEGRDKGIAEDQATKDRYWKILICYDDDEDYTISITPVLSTKEPVDSLIMEDEHLDTIPATESDEVIKSSVEELDLIQTFKDHSEIVVNSNDDDTSSDDDDFKDIEYVEASPPDLEIVSLEEVNDVDQDKEDFDLENIL